MPTGAFGQIYGQGVKYIKVNRYDSGGLDRSDYLGQLTNLTINYDDLGSITYNIVTTQEQNDYFVYGIQTQFQSLTSSNYEVLDYSWFIESSSAFNLTIGQVSPTNVTLLGGNTLNYFNISSGHWNFGNTPNQIIQVQISGNATWNVPAGGPTVTIFDNNTNEIIEAETLTGIVAGPQTNYPFNLTLILSSSYYSPIEEDSISFRFAKPGAGTYTINKLWISASLYSASVNPATSSLILFEPEFIDWDYNDYNALFGNAETPQVSTQFMDVDYTSTYDKPVNFDLIISGTADRALIQDSNYSSYVWSALRYWGSRYNSFNSFNYVPQSKIEFIRLGGNVTTNIGNFNDLSLDGSGYGELPAVEQNQTYMAYFDGVGGTGPELIGQTAYNIKYLIDTQGNIANPEPGVPALYNLIDNFESGKNAIVRLIENDPTLTGNPNDDALTGIHEITYVGRITPILYSQNGSGSLEYETTMSFALLGNILNPLNVGILTAKFSSTSNISSEPVDYTNFDFVAQIYSNNGSWSRVTGGSPLSASYQLNTSSIDAGTRIRFNTQFQISRVGPNNPGADTNFKFRIIKNRDFNNTFFESDWFPVPYDNSVSNFKQATTFWFHAEQNDEFLVQYKYSNTSDAQYRIFSGNNTYFMVEQEISPLNDFIPGVNTVTSSYWTIGDYSGSVTILTASGDLFNVYQQQGIYQIPSTSSLEFGFSPISTAFNPILPGDYIRFEYLPDAVYNITNVTTTPIDENQSASLFLTTVPPITSGSNLDNFVLYRVINDGTYVVLDVNKPVAGNGFTGIIQPEYVSQDLTRNYSNIIQDLTQKNLIS
jgi:hypothetical protein